MTPTESEPLLIDAGDFCRIANIGRSFLYGLIASGKAPPSFKLSRKRVWRKSDVLLWIEWNCCDAAEFEARKAAAGRRLKIG